MQARIEAWQRVLNMEHVRVAFDLELTEDREKAYATCYPHPNYDSTKIVFRSHLWADDAERTVDEVIVHELLHFLMRGYDRAARSVEDELGNTAQELYHERLIHEEEGVVDKLTVVIVNLCQAEDGTLHHRAFDPTSAATPPSSSLA